VNAVETNGKHARVELNNLNASPQSGQGGGRGSSTGVSRRDHGGGGVELASVTKWLQSMLARARNMQHAETNHLR